MGAHPMFGRQPFLQFCQDQSGLLLTWPRSNLSRTCVLLLEFLQRQGVSSRKIGNDGRVRCIVEALR